MKALTAGAPLYNGRRMARGCSRAQLIAAGKEIRGYGIRVAENRAFLPLDRNAHSASNLGGWHYAEDGYGAIDCNWTGKGANGPDETMILDLYALPALRRHRVKGILHKPRRRSDHKTWMHADQGVYNDFTVRTYSEAQQRRAAALVAAVAKGIPWMLPTGVNFAQDDRTARTRSGTSLDDRMLIRLIQIRAGVTPDGRYGPATAAAVKKRQVELAITADSKVGPTTWKAMGL